MGLLIWVFYKGIWSLAHVLNFVEARGIDDPGFVMQSVVFDAIGNAVEFAVWFGVAALLWILPYRTGHRGALLAGVLGAVSLCLVSATTVFLLSRQETGEIDWTAFKPGVISAVHFAAAGAVAAVTSQMAQVRDDADALVEDFN